MANEKPYTIAQMQAWIRSKGRRSTSARVAVLDHLQRSDAPLTHNELTEQLEVQGHQRASIYRNLIDLMDIGLINRFDAGDHTWRYEFASFDESPLHPHFLCIDCGIVSCVDGLSFKSAQLTSPAPIASVSEVIIKGQCRACA